MVDGEEYIIYDEFKKTRSGNEKGTWIRGVKAVTFTKVLGRSVFYIILIMVPLMLLLTAFGGYIITKKHLLRLTVLFIPPIILIRKMMFR